MALEHDLLLMEHMPLRLIFRAPVARVVRQAVIIVRGQLHVAAAEKRQLDGRAGAVGYLNPALDEIELPHGAIAQDGGEIIVFVLYDDAQCIAVYAVALIGGPHAAHAVRKDGQYGRFAVINAVVGGAFAAQRFCARAMRVDFDRSDFSVQRGRIVERRAPVQRDRHARGDAEGVAHARRVDLKQPPRCVIAYGHGKILLLYAAFGLSSV